MSESVRVWSETVKIPTYGVAAPNRNPMFLEKRVYQGSSGAVYPHPVIERVASEPRDEEWTAVFLENEFIHLMLLPQLGGRVQRALDKTNGYEFVYHNRVIKPALVGLTGPWISGGIEFNWPQHHRPSTYEAVDWSIERHADGSCTVWCAENERMFRTRGRHGFTVHPGRAGFDIHVRLYNGTAMPQTFLWWANPAVHVNDDYQSVFPPDVHAVMDHGKRDVSAFPIATGVYYKQDYAPGTDISRYKNIPVPTSYMAYHSDYDFVGCYDHGRGAGMLHVADHHLVPGKKQWTWGNGEFGRAWDRQLTDADGPYIELMCGAFTDNQPDFTWLMPGEEKRFTQTFMPYKAIGPASNANRDLAVRLAASERGVELGVYAAVSLAARVELWHNPGAPRGFHNHKNMHLYAPHTARSPDARRLFEEDIAVDAAGSWTHRVDLPADVPANELLLRVVDADGRERIAVAPPRGEKPAVPSPAVAARPPAEIASNEELFLNGLHLEQYRHATYAPEPYYEEALRRDPGDSRCHNALGRLLLQRGRFAEAELHFRAAIARLTARNPNPYDGEPYYNLGLALRFQSRFDEALDAFFKAAWSEAWKAPAYFELARLASRAGRFEEALGHVDQTLALNTRHQKARHLRIALLRRTGALDAALALARVALREDPLDFGARAEAQQLGLAVESAREGHPHYNALECGLDYAHAGLWEEADAHFARASDGEFLACYFRAETLRALGDARAADAMDARAAAQPLDFAFPNALECVPLLERALARNPTDALAAYALGNFWYARRRAEEAIARWEQCTRARPDFPTAWRNLGLAYANKRKDWSRAADALDRAFAADPSDARVLFELDQLDKETGVDPARRLARLDTHRARVLERDDLCVEYLHLLNLAGRAEEALDLLTTRVFQPWEGGEGKTTAQYLRSQFLLEERDEAGGNFAAALARLEQAGVLPPNLGEGRLGGASDHERHYRLGRLLRRMGRDAEAETHLEAATRVQGEPASAMYYNDQPPESFYFQGLAWRLRGDEARARAVFDKLVAYADAHIDDEIRMDYFAVSLPDFLVFDIDLTARNRRHCLFMRALGHAGAGRMDAARAAVRELLAQTPDHPVRHLLP
ncbi:MAG TPA: DUF5107 domain-containing protein [Kiritimatiellia bacterium]|nr:DUF5107 domain-containing protein [Kiritimatiellia bacterium]